MLCHWAQQTMHDDIASALVKNTVNVLAHQGHIPPLVEYHLARLVDYLWPNCPTELQDFVPDVVIITHAYPTSKAPSQVVIIKFAWSYTVKEDEMLTAGAAKRNQYLHLTSFLHNLYPDSEHVVIMICQSYIISILGLLVYPQSKWVENCESLNFTPAQSTKLQVEGVRACVVVGHALNNTVQSRT
eukprot:1799423-Rhodomonas_salina.1